MRKGIFMLFCLVAIVVLSGWVSSAQAYDSYGGGCKNCHGAFTDTSSPKGTWPVNKHDTHRNQMLDSTNADRCGACHQVNGDGTRTSSSRGYSGLPGLGCVGCHGNDYSGVKSGAGLRQHHRTKGADSCGATSCHAGDPTPKPESDKPPYYGLTGVKVKDPLNADGSEDWSNDGKGLDNDGNGLYDQNDPAAQVTPFEVTKPAAGESVPTGAPYTVTWTAPAGAASYKVKLSIDGGATWSTIGTGLSGTSTTWNVPTTVKKNITNAIIKVIAYNSNNIKLAVGKSGTFSIDVLTVTAPAAGAIVPQNAPYTITWTANGTSSPPDQWIVKYSLNNGSTWKTAIGALAGDFSSFSWNVPAVTKTKNNALVKVVLKANKTTVANAVSGKFTVQQ